MRETTGQKHIRDLLFEFFWLLFPKKSSVEKHTTRRIFLYRVFFKEDQGVLHLTYGDGVRILIRIGMHLGQNEYICFLHIHLYHVFFEFSCFVYTKIHSKYGKYMVTISKSCIYRSLNTWWIHMISACGKNMIHKRYILGRYM